VRSSLQRQRRAIGYWTTRGYANSRTGRLADATGDFACLVFVLLAASARPRVVQSASWRIRELSSYRLIFRSLLRWLSYSLYASSGRSVNRGLRHSGTTKLKRHQRNKEIVDIRLLFRFCPLVNHFAHAPCWRRICLADYGGNITSFTNRQYITMHCCQWRTEPRPHVTCTENFTQVRTCGFWDMRANRQTDRQTDTLIAILREV